MSGRQVKKTRQIIRKEQRRIRDSLVQQLKDLPARELWGLFWRLFDDSAQIRYRIFRKPRFFIVEKTAKWAFVFRFEKSWWVWDGNPIDMQGTGRSGWGVTFCGVRFDWRKDWKPSKSRAQVKQDRQRAAIIAGVTIYFVGLVWFTGSLL